MNYPTPKSFGTISVPRWIARTRAKGAEQAEPTSFDGRVYGIRRWKRILDILLASVGLIAAAPLIVAAVVAIKVTSPGPVFFKQERIGLNRRLGDRRRNGDRSGRRIGKDRRVLVSYGKPFTMYKFRSMVVSAEHGKPTFAQKEDPRVTKVGRVIRRTRIDELPQLLNVLRGDMSIVGPRPERAYFIREAQKDIPDFSVRLRAKPGLTGLAQVNLGYTNTVSGLRRKLTWDLEYLRNLSPWTDLKILIRTVSVVVTGRGAC